MRIISGIYGGRRFEAPRNLQARPTTDVAKEALFNILLNRIDIAGISALDLFAGTGSISFELLSREAASVVCVEMGRVQQQFIQKVAQELKVGRGLTMIRGDVFKFLKSSSQQFDLIFADPPYALYELPNLPDLILDGDRLKADGILIVEHGKDNDFSQHPHFAEVRKYGAVHFSFFSSHPSVAAEDDSINPQK